jgi:hypothetical protein
MGRDASKVAFYPGIEAKVAGRIIETPKDKDPFLSIDVADAEGKMKYIELS